MSKLLALDIGGKRVGYAITDADHTVAFPRGMMLACPQETFFAELRKVILEESVEKIIIGLPLGQDNEVGDSAMKIRKIGEKIAKEFRVPVEYVDETNSTNEALSKIPFRKDRRKKGVPDAIAAQIIMERYLQQKPCT